MLGDAVFETLIVSKNMKIRPSGSCAFPSGAGLDVQSFSAGEFVSEEGDRLSVSGYGTMRCHSVKDQPSFQDANIISLSWMTDDKQSSQFI